MERLRAVEKAREECGHSRRWAEDLRERFCAEKRSLKEKIANLEAKSGSASEAMLSTVGGSAESSGPAMSDCVTSPASSASAASASASTAVVSVSMPTASTSVPAASTSVTKSISTISSR